MKPTLASARRALVLLVLLAGGCGAQVRIYIDSPPTTNGGRPLRVLVRAVDSRAYMAESYQTVAQKVVTPDDSVLYDGIIYPGYSERASFRRGRGKSVAVYFFFTAPGPRWKTLIEQPLPRLERVRLRDDQIEQADRSD